MQIKGMNCRMLLILVKGIELKLLDGSTIWVKSTAKNERIYVFTSSSAFLPLLFSLYFNC